MSTQGNEAMLHLYKKKPIPVPCHQWHKNGDHPDDDTMRPFEDTNLAPIRPREGSVVRYFRHPSIDGASECRTCHHIMHAHGWIDTLEGGHTVCPGDWILTGVKGEHWPVKPDIFAATYEPVTTSPAPCAEVTEDIHERLYDGIHAAIEKNISEMRTNSLGMVVIDRSQVRSALLAAGVGKGDGWVSVKDDLPEDNEYVLWCRAPVCEPYEVLCMCSDGWSDGFTHWRNLPAPPSSEIGDGG